VNAQASSPKAQHLATGVLESLAEDKLVLSIPGTDYRLTLVPAVPASAIATPIGKRIKGAIHAQALRMHTAAGGGRFIEPVYGMPRIVAGKVLDIDADRRQVVVDVAVPMIVTTMPEQRFDIFTIGSMVNFYINSGATFTPAP
jgi:hypothetical protein